MSQRNQLSRLAPSISSWSNPWEYSFYYTTQIWQDWQNWGQVWGQPQVTEVSTAAAHENPYIQTAHTGAARINRYGEGAGAVSQRQRSLLLRRKRRPRMAASSVPRRSGHSSPM